MHTRAKSREDIFDKIVDLIKREEVNRNPLDDGNIVVKRATKRSNGGSRYPWWRQNRWTLIQRCSGPSPVRLRQSGRGPGRREAG